MLNFWLNLTDTQRWKYWFSRSYILLLLLAIYIPLVTFCLLSFSEVSPKGNISTSLRSFSGVENYAKFFSDSSFTENMGEGLVNSLIIALISTPISLLIGLLTAISIWRGMGRNQRVIFSICNFSMACPDIVQGITFSMLFASFLIPLGINLGFFTIILTHIALSVPYVVLFIYPRLSKISPNLLSASHDLNYGFLETIFNVLCPLLLPNLCGAAIIVFSVSFDDFIITNLVRGSVTTITSELYNMRHGIKAWAAVFGSLVFMGITLAVLVSGLYKTFFRGRND